MRNIGLVEGVSVLASFVFAVGVGAEVIHGHNNDVVGQQEASGLLDDVAWDPVAEVHREVDGRKAMGRDAGSFDQSGVGVRLEGCVAGGGCRSVL